MAHKIRFGDRHIKLPGSRILRVVIGVLLVLGGILGFLPILGFWMIPLGLLILSVDVPAVRRWRRQLTVWWHRRKQEKDERKGRAGETGMEDPRTGNGSAP
ncbi:hypothetical protein [Methyloligella halotolerans]|nr:hypothetical protein [Methyloligella halotolerans]